VIAAPVATLVGIAAWAIAWAMGAGPGGMVFTATVLACVTALIGARRRVRPLGCGGTVRPVLGALGGLGVSLVGLLVGLAIQAVL
jgi:hypothetical protein